MALRMLFENHRRDLLLNGAGIRSAISNRRTGESTGTS